MMSNQSETFAAAITCIDGRAHAPVTAWLRATCGVTFVDRITQPGADRLLASGDAQQRASLRATAALSIAAHGARVIAVVGHHDCAANPATEHEHRQQIRAAVAEVASWSLPARVIGLWVNDAWQVEVVAEAASGSLTAVQQEGTVNLSRTDGISMA